MVNNFASPLSILHLRTSRSDIKLLFGRQIVMKLVTNQTQKNQPKPKKTSKTHQNYLKTSKLSVISINYSKFFMCLVTTPPITCITTWYKPLKDT